MNWNPCMMNDEKSCNLLNLSWKSAVIWFYAFSIAIAWMPNDERYGKNRQRIMDYNSPEEKRMFNEIRTLESNLIRSQSHLEFFKQCQRLNIRPNNLEYNSNFNVAFADDSIKKKLG